MVYRYVCYGLELASPEPLSGLRPSTAETHEVEVALDPAPGFSTHDLRRVWDGPEGAWLRARRDATTLSLAFPGMARFDVRLPEGRIRCRLHDADIPRSMVHHLLLNHVLPLFMSLQGDVVLHGSAVAHESRAIALLGHSGGGKSTLALRMARRGARVLTDDALRLVETTDGYDAVPGYPCLRFWDEDLSREGLPPRSEDPTHKRWVSPAEAAVQFAEAPCPLTAVYVLGGDDAREISIQPMRGAGRFVALVGHTVQLGPMHPERGRDLLARLTVLAQRIPVYDVQAPRKRRAIDALAATLWKHGFHARQPAPV